MLSKVNSAIARLQRIDETQKDNINDFLEQSIIESLQFIDAKFEDIILELSSIYSFSISPHCDIFWRVVCTGCYLLIKLSSILKNDPNSLLSVQQTNNIRKLLQFIVSNGIHPSLLPGVGISIQRKDFVNKLDDFEKYKRLKAVCKFINEIYEIEELKAIIIIHYFNDYLAALHQLSYAPIVKPNTVIVVNNQPFQVTQEIWENLQRDQKEFQSVLKIIITKTNQEIIIKELIVLQGVKSSPLPNFMKRALSKQLSECLMSKGGLHALMQCFLDSPNIDIGAQWKNIDMVVRLVSVKHGTMSDNEYLNIICKQLSDIIKIFASDNYIVVAAACTASLYNKFETNQHVQSLIEVFLSPFVIKNSNSSETKTTTQLNSTAIQNGVHKLDLCYSHPKLSLPTILLTPIIHSLFLLRTSLESDSALSYKLNNLLCKHIIFKLSDIDDWFNVMIFDKENGSVPINKIVRFEILNGEIGVKNNDNMCIENIGQRIDTIIEILDKCPDNNNLHYKLFLFLLNFFMESNYLPQTNISEDISNRKCEVMLYITKALEILVSKECVLKCFKDNPCEVTEFIKKFLIKFSTNIVGNNRMLNHSDECLTISLVLLSTLISDDTFDKKDLQDIVEPLKTIMKQSSDTGTKYLCKEVIKSLSVSSFREQKDKSKFDDAINQICDPLLPVRAHGLMELTKLIEKKDVETLSKKELVQCIFQENLKDTDSYIYLSAINGLSTLAKFCTEDVLEILSREYLNQSNNLAYTSDAEDEHLKLRMKIGEILLKTTKNLGDTAMDHKAILLNTFLSGCHDTDNFMRASSLSNLAELCKILSYKLGDIIFDILKSVDNIIQYDKSIECRRAGVFVISNLIKGLGKESLFFLRDALLPMYRTLKKLYTDEKEDSAVRLHAQIALEELNDIMREIMAPYLKNTEKR